jgi:hypothetical protein
MFPGGAYQTNEPVCGRVLASKGTYQKHAEIRSYTYVFEAEYTGQRGYGHGPPQLAVITKIVPFPFPGDYRNSAAPDSWLSLPL